MMPPAEQSSQAENSKPDSESQRDLVVLLDRAESRERAHLAEVLHDDPLQLVIAALLRIDTLSGKTGIDDGTVLVETVDLADISRILETASEQLRNVIITLTPPDLDAGLGSALRLLADSTFLGTRTRVRFVGPDHVPLALDVADCAYRIAREALINVRKHARATEVVVTLEDLGSTVVLRVVDDGIGIGNPAEAPGHLGMASMRARAATVGAELLFNSPPGGGTVVELVLAPESSVRSTSPAGSH